MRFIALTITCLLLTPSVSFANEGAGLLSSDLEGALPKALWRDQPRSEIAEALKKLPANSPSRSIQQIKRNMLLSPYDISLIKDDVKPAPENNLLTLRLQKLIEMGLWEDAFQLYTTEIDDPEDNAPLAQTGILLILLNKGLGTACLEEKAYSSRFSSEGFWRQINQICNIELGSMLVSTADFAESESLSSLYKDDRFEILANQTAQLSALSPLELAMQSIKGRINYQELDLEKEISPNLLKTFLEDKKFPESQRALLSRKASQKAILPQPALPEYVGTTKQRTQSELINLISYRLKQGGNISPSEIKRLQDLAPLHLENFVYLQCINIFTPSGEKQTFSDGDLKRSYEALSIKSEKKVNFIKSLLDKHAEFSNNPANVYEKPVNTASEEDSSTKESQTDQIENTIRYDYPGLGLLIMLSNIENRPWGNSSTDTSNKDVLNMLKSLSDVGLIDQAHRIVKEELADLMVLKN